MRQRGSAFEAVLERQERVLGIEHPKTLATAHEFGVCLDRMGDHATAREHLETVLARRESVLGAEHPDTLATAREVGVCLRELG
jgi:hypothetical protein